MSHGEEMIGYSYLSRTFYKQLLEQVASSSQDYLVAPHCLPCRADEAHVHQRGGGLKGGKYGFEVLLVGEWATPRYPDA